MKKIVAAAVLAAAFAAPALAEGGDMAELTCTELLSMDDSSKGVILFWIDGYLSHKSGVTMVDFDQIKANGAKLGEYCAGHGDAKVLEYVESASN